MAAPVYLMYAAVWVAAIVITIAIAAVTVIFYGAAVFIRRSRS